jgi:hypothetical protein
MGRGTVRVGTVRAADSSDRSGLGEMLLIQCRDDRQASARTRSEERLTRKLGDPSECAQTDEDTPRTRAASDLPRTLR